MKPLSFLCNIRYQTTLKLHLCLYLLLTAIGVCAQKTEIQYLSGTDKDNTVKWDFFCSEGMNSGNWTTIDVPSQWELQGFGGYNYGHDRTPHNEKGFYRYEFSVSPQWKNKEVYIVFEGSMTDTEVRINKQLAGPIHQGAFYRFKYNISELLDYSRKNLLEVAVSKESSNESINRAERRADYWIFGGIFRPVYLEAQPKSFIDRVAINAKQDGSFYMESYTHNADSEDFQIETRIQTLEGKDVSTPFLSGHSVTKDKFVLNGQIEAPLSWTPESPYLYKAVVKLKKGKKVVHSYEQKFGFRTIEFRKSDGFYVNGVKVKFKGVCRHTFWPESGRTSSKQLAIEDVNLIKDMNMNAVRMSHYPPDQYFLDVCDSLGLFVINELAGWQNKYDTPTARRLVQSMVTRDVNHPSIVIWANGNEGGFNTEVRSDYALYDPQKRQVIEPWSKMDGTDTKHYPKYNYSYEALTKGNLVYMPTEFLHGLHDGGHGAGLDDYWNLMLKSPLSAGGFLWNLADEGVVRRDTNDSIDVKGNYAPDGILGPHHEKEGNFYTIKEVWTPVYVTNPNLNSSFNGVINISNRYHFTNLNQCRFSYKLTSYTQPLNNENMKQYTHQVAAPNVTPGQEGIIRLELPEDWHSYDVLYLTAIDPFGREIFTWSWNVTMPQEMVQRIVTGANQELHVQETDELLRVTCGTTEITFNKRNGWIDNVCHQLKNLSFNNGPRFTGFTATFRELKHYHSPDGYVVEALYENADSQRWTIQPNGWVQLDYQYKLNGEYDYAGITFSYPENKVKGATLMANGPYHVWKNRMKGTNFGVYNKAYNNTITGQNWKYPEFKGYYSNFYAVEIQTDEMPFIIASATKDVFLHLFTPEHPLFYSKNINPRFPEGDISFLNTICAVGTKFSRAEQEGPQGAKNIYNNEVFRGRLYFKFGSQN